MQTEWIQVMHNQPKNDYGSTNEILNVQIKDYGYRLLGSDTVQSWKTDTDVAS
jgi:hypothetical protein